MSKRITIPISNEIDEIKIAIEHELGFQISYAQLIDYLINFYQKKTVQPKTQWRHP